MREKQIHSVVIRTHVAAALVTVLVGMCGGCANAKYDRGYELDSFLDVVQVRGMPPIAQSKKYQCGYACLASVALYYDVNPVKLTETSIVKKFSGRPLSAKELLEMAKQFGLIGYAYKGSLDDLTKNLKKGRPVIILLGDPPRTADWPSFEWAQDTGGSMVAVPHWVVVTGLMPDGKFVLQDPRKGRLVITTKALMAEWKKKSSVSVLIGVRTS